jgi:hypothetical protein
MLEEIIYKITNFYKLKYNDPYIRLLEDLNVEMDIERLNNMNETGLKWEILRIIEKYDDYELEDFSERIKIILNNILNGI